MSLLPRALCTLTSVLAAGVAVAACTTTATDAKTLAQPHTQTPAAAARAHAPAAVTKLLVFVEENHSLDQMRSGMPYTAGLANEFGYATDYHAIRHPSLPNYLAIAGGQTFGVTRRRPARPATGSPAARCSARRCATAGPPRRTPRAMPALRAARTSGAPTPSSTTRGPTSPASARACRAHDLGDARASVRDAAAGRLPNVGMVVPNLCHDAHDGSLATADAWFRTQMQKVFAGPDWRSGRLAVVLTADEDDRTQGNKVLTVVIHPSQRHHVVTHPADALLADPVVRRGGAPAVPANAGTAPSMASAFGLPLA